VQCLKSPKKIPQLRPTANCGGKLFQSDPAEGVYQIKRKTKTSQSRTHLYASTRLGGVGKVGVWEIGCWFCCMKNGSFETIHGNLATISLFTWQIDKQADLGLISWSLWSTGPKTTSDSDYQLVCHSHGFMPTKAESQSNHYQLLLVFHLTLGPFNKSVEGKRVINYLT